MRSGYNDADAAVDARMDPSRIQRSHHLTRNMEEQPTFAEKEPTDEKFKDGSLGGLA